jgi:photosystem II stability/assembly factor-like uncharacterized protein
LRCLRTVTLLLLVAVLPAGCAAPWGGPRFVPAGLTDLVVLALLVEPSGALLAGTSDGIHRSEDAGRTWRPVAGLPPGTAVPGLGRGPDAFYAATGRGAFRSLDGRAWQPLGTGLPLDAPLLSIAADPADPRRLVAGSGRRGVFRSTDGGQTWRSASAGLPRELPIYVITPDPGRPTRLLAGTIGAGLQRSDDGGLTWAPAGVGIPPATNVFSIAGDGAGALGIGTGAGFFRSDDGGQTWRWSKDVLGHTRVVALARDPATPHRLIAGADDGVHVSGDDGRSWRRLAEGLPDGEHVGAVAVVKGRVVVGAGPAWALDP